MLQIKTRHKLILTVHNKTHYDLKELLTFAYDKTQKHTHTNTHTLAKKLCGPALFHLLRLRTIYLSFTHD